MNHGTEGEIYISHLDYIPGFEVLQEALAEQGIPIGDLNSGEFPNGFSKLDHNIKDGLRWSAYHGFLEPILDRSNLKIYRYAWASKVILICNHSSFQIFFKKNYFCRFILILINEQLGSPTIDMVGPTMLLQIKKLF